MSFLPITAKYDQIAVMGTDMREHMPTLRSYAAQCAHVTEFGVDDCTSTWGLLAGFPKHMRSYDVVRKPEVTEVEALAAVASIDFKFIEQSSLVAEIEPTDLLFIDSYHSYTQLKEEFRLHASKVRRYILMHDTVTFGLNDQDGKSPSLLLAIEHFLAEHPEWKTAMHYTNCHGLMVLERQNGNSST